ncbi:hypothetical protein N0V88_000920 [Collariella sp. IMI 366227]|nr:hypothetical protein N0V88_000920 [Collariella sp. IMI 366227]
MAAPLSPTPSAALNFSTPTASLRHEPYETYDSRPYPASTKPLDNMENRSCDDGDSSPFLSHIKDDVSSPTPRGPSPPKPRPGSRIMTGHELSPLKILQQQQQSQVLAQTQNQQSPSTEEVSSPARSMPPPSLPQSPRKGPIKRFPVKINQPGSASSESPRRPPEERRSSTERPSSLRESVTGSEGLKHVIDIFEDEVNAMDIDDPDHHDLDHTPSLEQDAGHEQSMMMEEEHGLGDASMVSTFSTFSAVPNLTMLAQMRSDSPTKFSATGSSTPRTTGRPDPSARTPRANGSYDGNNTSNLMDFTEQMRYGAYGTQPTPSRMGMPTPLSLVNLLDFDIPPMPTPRSMPSITPRELESLKSGFLSEISSLKASLSGKEAEVLSLKTAVGDAEKRVGECMEQLREVQGAQEALQTEKDSWERRGREMEVVLRKVREEIGTTQREREELEFKLDEAEKRGQAAEMMAQEAESKMAGMRAGKASAEAAAAATSGEARVPGAVSHKEVEMAVERVARELHALYKSKHETKVAALKKSYESRWEKRVRQLQVQADELARENEDLRRRSPPHHANNIDPARLVELEAERARDAAQLRELEAEVEKVEAVLRTVQADNAELRVLLERERVEKGELVMLAEEMMNMQQNLTTVAAVPEEDEEDDFHPYPPQQSQHQPQYQSQQQQYQPQQPQYQNQYQPQYQPQHQPQYQQPQYQPQQQPPLERRRSTERPSSIERTSSVKTTTTTTTPARRRQSSSFGNAISRGTPGHTKTRASSTDSNASGHSGGNPMQIASSNNGSNSTTNFRASMIGAPGGGPGGNSNFRASGLRAPGSTIKAPGSLNGGGFGRGAAA